MQIKAMLMNSAKTAVYTNPALLPGELAPISRIGAGEVRVDRAIAERGCVERETKSAALSYGAVEVDGVLLSPQVRVDNFRRQGGRTPSEASAMPTMRPAAPSRCGPPV